MSQYDWNSLNSWALSRCSGQRRICSGKPEKKCGTGNVKVAKENAVLISTSSYSHFGKVSFINMFPIVWQDIPRNFHMSYFTVDQLCPIEIAYSDINYVTIVTRAVH